MARTSSDGEVKVMGLGLGGVNLVKDPLALDDNEVTLAQNAVPFKDKGVAGIRKRDGWARVVPTGTVTPGSDAGGAILGGFVIDGPLGSAPPDGAGTGYGNGYYYDPDTNTWTAFTPDQSSGPLPNVCMDYVDGYDITKSTVYPPIPYSVTGSFIMGGHESGQIIELAIRRGPRNGGPINQFVAREIARISATGSVDDTYVLPCWISFSGLDDGRLVVTTEAGGMWTVEPITGATTKLPDLPNTTRATGALFLGTRLWVCSALKIYTIGMTADGGWDDAWQEAATVSDSGITQLLGMCQLPSGVFQVGSIISAGGGTQNLRIYVFSPSTADGSTWTATQLAFPGGAGVQSNGTAMVQIQATPAAMIPFPLFTLRDPRTYALFVGNCAAFVTLWGSQSESMSGTSVRVLSYDTLMGWWHNGADTLTDDLVNDYCGGNAASFAAPALTLDLKHAFLGNVVTGGRWAFIHRPIFEDIAFGPTGSPSSGLPNSFWNYPVTFF